MMAYGSSVGLLSGLVGALGGLQQRRQEEERKRKEAEARQDRLYYDAPTSEAIRAAGFAGVPATGQVPRDLFSLISSGKMDPALLRATQDQALTGARLGTATNLARTSLVPSETNLAGQRTDNALAEERFRGTPGFRGVQQRAMLGEQQGRVEQVYLSPEANAALNEAMGTSGVEYTRRTAQDAVAGLFDPSVWTLHYGTSLSVADAEQAEADRRRALTRYLASAPAIRQEIEQTTVGRAADIFAKEQAMQPPPAPPRLGDFITPGATMDVPMVPPRGAAMGPTTAPPEAPAAKHYQRAARRAASLRRYFRPTDLAQSAAYVTAKDSNAVWLTDERGQYLTETDELKALPPEERAQIINDAYHVFQALGAYASPPPAAASVVGSAPMGPTSAPPTMRLPDTLNLSAIGGLPPDKVPGVLDALKRAVPDAYNRAYPPAAPPPQEPLYVVDEKGQTIAIPGSETWSKDQRDIYVRSLTNQRTGNATVQAAAVSANTRAALQNDAQAFQSSEQQKDRQWQERAIQLRGVVDERLAKVRASLEKRDGTKDYYRALIEGLDTDIADINQAAFDKGGAFVEGNAYGSRADVNAMLGRLRKARADAYSAFKQSVGAGGPEVTAPKTITPADDTLKSAPPAGTLLAPAWDAARDAIAGLGTMQDNNYGEFARSTIAFWYGKGVTDPTALAEAVRKTILRRQEWLAMKPAKRAKLSDDWFWGAKAMIARPLPVK